MRFYEIGGKFLFLLWRQSIIYIHILGENNMRERRNKGRKEGRRKGKVVRLTAKNVALCVAWANRPLNTDAFYIYEACRDE